MALKPRPQLFVDEYMKDRNATQAAIRAGYSKKTAGSIGEENLKKPEISAEVQRRMAQAGKEHKIDKDRLLSELSKGAFHSIDLETWRPVDKLKAIEIIAKLLGLLDGKRDEDKRDTESTAQRLLDAVERVKARRSGTESSDGGAL